MFYFALKQPKKHFKIQIFWIQGPFFCFCLGTYSNTTTTTTTTIAAAAAAAAATTTTDDDDDDDDDDNDNNRFQQSIKKQTIKILFVKMATKADCSAACCRNQRGIETESCFGYNAWDCWLYDLDLSLTLQRQMAIKIAGNLHMRCQVALREWHQNHFKLREK